ncbi:hypothetical protein Agub_g4274, partial [Astrephomene gubernaculifera]
QLLAQWLPPLLPGHSSARGGAARPPLPVSHIHLQLATNGTGNGGSSSSGSGSGGVPQRCQPLRGATSLGALGAGGGAESSSRRHLGGGGGGQQGAHAQLVLTYWIAPPE